MLTIDDATKDCLLSILQRGITEGRTLALCGQLEAVADLLDALDNIPRHLANWSDKSESCILGQMQTLMQSVPTLPTNYAWMFENRICTL